MSSLAKLVPVARLKYLTKIRDITIDDITFRLHYRFTFSFFLIGSLLLAGEQLFGKPIQCVNMNAGDSVVPSKIIESYCWIEGTFTLPKALIKTIGYEVAAPGVEQYKQFVEEAKQMKDEVIEHSYYQWVGIILFLQSITFYIPHLAWKHWEKGRMNNIINDLNKTILSRDKKTLGKSNLVNFLHGSFGNNNAYAFRLFLCEVFNLVNCVIQMLLINWVLNGEFTSYGFDVLQFLDGDVSERVDPMAKVFPKMTKCTFQRFGPSGDIVRTDHLCMLPLNIFNEKLYVCLWFWLYLVLLLSAFKIVSRLVLIAFPYVREALLTKLHRLADPKDIEIILDQSSYSDWFLIHLLSKNIDPMHFRDVMKDLAKKLKEPLSDYEKQIDESNV